MRIALWLACLAWPASLLSQPSPNSALQPSRAGATVRAAEDGEFQLRINGSVDIPAGDTTATVWVINGDATVGGWVREVVFVVNGTGHIAGHVGTVIVVRGRLELAPGARVDGDVILHRSAMVRAADAVVAGEVHHRQGFSFGAAGMWFAWAGFTVVVLAAGGLFLVTAPRVLQASAAFLPDHGGASAVGALLLVVGLPTLAIASFVTVIGIPLGVTILLVAIPSLTFLGYLVAGAALGTSLTARGRGHAPLRYQDVALGIILLQVVGAIPGIGGLAVLVASQLGAGALVARAWSSRRPVAAMSRAPAGA